MTTRHPARLALATTTALLSVTVALSACGSSESDHAAPTTSTTTSSGQTSTSGAATQTSTGNRAVAELGTTQTVTADGATARLQVKNEPARILRTGSTRTVTFPVVVDVESGSLDVGPSHWKLTTLSGKTLSADSTSGLPTALGDTPIDSHAEGLIAFTDYNSGLGDQVSIDKIGFYPGTPFTSNTPAAQWRSAPSIAVSAIPTTAAPTN